MQEHRFEFDEAPSVEAVALQLSRLTMKFNGYDREDRAGSGRDEEDNLAMARPMGVALLLAGVDEGGGPVLYHVDPSGSSLGISMCCMLEQRVHRRGSSRSACDLFYAIANLLRPPVSGLARDAKARSTL